MEDFVHVPCLGGSMLQVSSQSLCPCLGLVLYPHLCFLLLRSVCIMKAAVLEPVSFSPPEPFHKSGHAESLKTIFNATVRAGKSSSFHWQAPSIFLQSDTEQGSHEQHLFPLLLVLMPKINLFAHSRLLVWFICVYERDPAHGSGSGQSWQGHPIISSSFYLD